MGLGEKILAVAADKIIEKVEKTDPIELLTSAVNLGGRVLKTISNSVGEIKDGIFVRRERYLDLKMQTKEKLENFAQEIKNSSWQLTIEKTNECIGFIDEIDYTDEKTIESVCVCLSELKKIISSKFNEMRE